MAIMSPAERTATWASFMQEMSRTRGQMPGITKAELKAAIDAADGWADANDAAYNSALPLPARTVLTSPQKALLLLWVIRRRALGN